LKVYHNVAGICVDTTIPEARNKGDNFDKKIRSFIDAIEYGLPSPVPSGQIIYNQAILDGIARSARLGREVAIEIPEI
ncbi:MAG TPA: gfo/Idh/MocA family oxidoreductase, partial [Clostridiales bacterium]|nr:gfo/Idh/MocA family oxidoreductase [Clostridiales bacterium]